MIKIPYGDTNRPREIFPATPFLFLQTRDDVLQWSTDAALVWTIESVNTKDFQYKTGKSAIFILTSGYYEIIYELSVYLYSGAMDYTAFGVYQNGILMDGSASYTNFPDGHPSSVSAHFYSYLNNGDYLQLISAVGAGGGTLRTMQNSVRFIIKFMPAKGWDNSHGGTESYRGGVLR